MLRQQCRKNEKLEQILAWQRTQVRNKTEVLDEARNEGRKHRVRLIMQHVYGHGGNLGNECADHAAALGTFGLTSSHNVDTAGFIIILTLPYILMVVTISARFLERLQHIRTDATSLHQNRSQRCVHRRVHCVSCASHAHFYVIGVPALSLLFEHGFFVLSNK